MAQEDPQVAADWLIRIAEVFTEFNTDIVAELEAVVSKKLGTEYLRVQLGDPEILQAAVGKYVRWNMPIQHSWPCNPEAMPQFIEKAAQGLLRRFGNAAPQAILMGQLDPSAGNRYYKMLASNLRGRTLQLFPAEIATFHEIEAQDSTRPTLFCMVGKEGLFAGMQSPLASNGLYPGGTKYISQSSSQTISRAGAKIAEALHYLGMIRPAPLAGSHWLELGACPGGMTAELLQRNYQVTAIDRAPLDKRLDRAARLHFSLGDVATFVPIKGSRYAAILSDMNGDALESIRQIVRLASFLEPDGLVVFTLKTPGAATFLEINQSYEAVVKLAAAGGLQLIAKTHLTYNRLEFTLFFSKSGLS
jgi:23S rRNA (cytidine2498-2'-O)-methyltransferase